jgi:phospholipase/lecithinase/hemolysin
MQFNRLQMLLAAFTTAVLVAACGGGGDAAGPKTSITRVYVAGDSLADVGAQGFKYTVQKSGDPAGYPLYPQIVAANYGVTGQCAYYSEAPANNVVVGNASCTNYAVEGGRIITPVPRKSVTVQLTEMGANIGTFAATDLIIVDSGSNDAQDLAKIVFGFQQGAVTATQFQNFFLQQLTPTELGTTPAAQLPVLYMQKLADTYYNTVKTNLLDRGAKNVALLNITDITVIPAFIIGTGGDANAKAAAQLWVQAFNARLQADVGADDRIILVDFYTDTQEEIANFASFGLTNATDAACDRLAPATPSPSCSDVALDAVPPAGQTAGWWKTYAFADEIHPTPYGHQLLANSVSRALARAGRL